MSRPKKNTPEGKKAVQKWRETMKEKHGDISKFFITIGAKGGANGHTGGFAGNSELARKAGTKGGRVSKRSYKTYTKEWYEMRERIIVDYKQYNMSIKELSRKYEIPYHTLRRHIKEEGIV